MFSFSEKKWLGSFRSADDSSFPQPVKPFVLPRPPLSSSILFPIFVFLILCNCTYFLLLSDFPLLCFIIPHIPPSFVSSFFTPSVAFFRHSSSLLLNSLSLQVMWMQVKAHWWAISCICLAMSTSVPCTSMSRSRKRQEKPPLPMHGYWTKLARRETGTHWPWIRLQRQENKYFNKQ